MSANVFRVRGTGGTSTVRGGARLRDLGGFGVIWTNVSFPYASRLTAVKMTQLHDNFHALARAAPGAPQFVNAALDSNPVTQPKLKTAAAAGSLTLSATSVSDYTLTGGTYSWWTASGTKGGTGFGPMGIVFSSGDEAAGVIGIGNRTSSSVDFYLDERYIQASPPYNLGNGDIPLFIFLMFDQEKNLVGMSLAPDPPWAYHGPTNILPHRIDTVSGRAWAKNEFVGDVPLSLAIKDKNLLRSIMLGHVEVVSREVEITHELKNRDMSLFPHNFKAGKNTVVMVDPLCSAVQRFLEAQNQGADGTEVRAMLRKVKLKDCNPFNTPPGVKPVRGVL